MDERNDSPKAHVELAATVTGLSRRTRLAFEKRHLDDPSLVARDLVFLPPDVLDIDLADPLQRDFGDFELLEKIGQGGMGVVYRARQRSLDREVALKLLIAGPSALAEFMERFQREAQSAARLEHPNIVTVYEVGRRQDLHYFSMRLVRGEALSAVVRRRGGLPAREAARVLLVVADAVDYAHRLGVLHLDLKPGNVLIDNTGEPLVADFGLARRLDDVLVSPARSASGTPSYMAPEQADSTLHPIGIATDIYGLGCILYEMLCARAPFIAATTKATLDRVLRDEIEPLRIRAPDTPRDLEAICLKCLCKDPTKRYQSAVDLAEDLRAFLSDRSVSVRRPSPIERLQRWIKREPRLATAVAGVAAALVMGLGATFQQWQRAEGNASAARQVTWESRRETALQLEQDGRGHAARDRLLANLREQETYGEVEQAALERIRLGVMLGRGAHLIDAMVVRDASPMASRLSPDGSLLAIAFADLTLRWYDTDTLQELGQISLESSLAPNGINAIWRTSDREARLPQLLRFVDDDRLLVTLEWIRNRVNPTEADTWLVDISRKSVIDPPEQLTVAAYSANGQWALLADRDGRIELWQSTPRWSRVSELGDADPQALAWVLADDGRSAYSLRTGMRGMRRYDLTGKSEPRVINVPGDEGISAWTMSSDRRTLAIGTFDGNAFVLDTETFELRKLPTQRGREITWLQFGENDAWLAIAEYDGLVQVVDVSAGDLLIGVGMRAGFTVKRVAVSQRERLVIASGAGRTALWRLPRSNFRVRPAERIGTAPADHAQAWAYASDWSLETGLFADAGMDGQVRLWRLPRSPSIAATPPQQAADEILDDDDRLVDIEWNQLRLMSPEGHALTHWLDLERPPGFAELLDEGRILLVTVGTQLHVFDTNALTPRYPPVALPATPERILASADGRFVLLSFGRHGDFGHEELLRSFDAFEGRWLPGEAVLDGPIRRYALSPDGDWVVAQGPPLFVTTVLQRSGLEVIAEYVHDPRAPVASLDFQGSRLLLVTQPQPEEPNCASPRPSGLLAWDPVTGEEARLDFGDGAPCLVKTLASGHAVFGSEYDLLVHKDHTVRLPRLVTAPVEGRPFVALSPDGRVLARGFRHEVQLHDAASGELIGVPLYADISALDFLAHLEFVDEGRALRGRSLLGVNLQWSTREATNEILVRQSPGPWSRAEARPAVPLTADSRPGVAIPARDPAAPRWLLDLSPAYNHSPWNVRNTFFYAMASLRGTPMGVQRIGGVDFDIRGVVQLGGIEQGNAETLQRIECLPVPSIPSAAVHLLVHNGLETPVPAGRALAELTLHYVDGTETRLPLDAGVELMSYGFDDSLVPIVFATRHLRWRAGGPLYELSAPRLENPEPGRLIRCLDLSWLESSGSFAVLAITIEPVGSDVDVIDLAESGNMGAAGMRSAFVANEIQ